MSFLHGAGDIHHGQQHKDEGLNDRGKNHQHEDGHGHQQGHEQQDDGQNDILPHDVSEEPDGQGDGA